MASTDTTSFIKSPKCLLVLSVALFYVEPCLVVPWFLVFFLSLTSFHVLLKFPLYSVVLKNPFIQKAVGHRNSCQTNESSGTGLTYLGVPFALVNCPVVLRTDGRMHRDVVPKTQISGIDEILYFVTYGALRARQSCAIYVYNESKGSSLRDLKLVNSRGSICMNHKFKIFNHRPLQTECGLGMPIFKIINHEPVLVRKKN